MSGNGGVEVRFNLHLAGRRNGTSPGSENSGVSRGRLPRISQVLAMAITIQEMVHRGEVKDYADFARQRSISRERVSQVMKLVWLAPDIQVEILYLPPSVGGRYPISELSLRRIGEMLSWAEQRAAWGKLKRERKLMDVAEEGKPPAMDRRRWEGQGGQPIMR